MVQQFSSFICNSKFGKVRRVVANGRVWLVAPITSITADGVLPGSRGPLLYPSKETMRAVKDWDGVPLVENHPVDRLNQHVPANEVPDKHLGYLRNSRWQGKLTHQAHFDEQWVKERAPEVYSALISNRPLEISTGLYTTNIPAPNGYATNSRGRPYTAIATNHRPDHMAILPHQKGACSLDDGCGLLVNKRLDDWLEEHGMDEDDFEEMAEDQDMTVEELEQELGITANDANFASEAQRKFMWSQHPDIAEDWAHGEHSSDKDHKMPEETGEDVHVKKKATANMLDDAKRAAIWNQLGQFLLNGGGGGGDEQSSPAKVKRGFGMRGDDTALEQAKEQEEVDNVWLTYNREWPQAKRDKLAEKDFAGPDQSFPISTQEDLDAAIHSIGRAKDPATVKAGIRRIAKRKGLKLPDTETWNAHPQQARHPQNGTYLQMAHTAAKGGYHSDTAAPAHGVGPKNGPGDDGRNQAKIQRVKPIDVDADDDGPHDDDGYNKVDEEAEHTAEVPPMPSKRPPSVKNRYHADVNEKVGPCPECGGEVSGGVCVDCGHKLTGNAKKCPECGGEMKDGECEDCGYEDDETNNCAMGPHMDNDDQAAGASKDAAMASMDHPPARDHAIGAHDAAQDDDHAGAVAGHKKAANAHDKAAQASLDSNDIEGVNSHMKAAMLHRKAAAMHAATTNEFEAAAAAHREAAEHHREEGDTELAKGHSAAAAHHTRLANKGSKRTDNMALTLNKIQGMDRDQLLVMLTRNCTCSKEKSALPNLNTETLRKLAVANAKATGSNADTVGDANSPGVSSGGWDKTHKSDQANYTDDAGKGLDSDTDDKGEGDFEDESDSGKHPATENELRARLKRQKVDPVVANMAISHFRETNEKKRQLILNMLERVTDNAERNRLGNKWFRLSLEDLQDMAKISARPVRNETYEEDLQPVANYGGADSFDQLVANGEGGDGSVINQDADEDYCMNAGRRIDYAAVSAENRPVKWQKFVAERNGQQVS